MLPSSVRLQQARHNPEDNHSTDVIDGAVSKENNAAIFSEITTGPS